VNSVIKSFITLGWAISVLLCSATLQAGELEEFEIIIQQAKAESIDNPLPGTDPYEPFNRAMFKFNMVFHNTIGAPLAHAYLKIVPQPIQTGLSNFFDNLAIPIHTLNSFLQGKGKEGLEGVMSFSLNTVFGLGGLIDIATPSGLNPPQEDFGQTLYKWGLWPESHYLVLPIFGPYTTRSLFGNGIDDTVDPIYLQKGTLLSDNHWQLNTTSNFIKYSKATPFIDELKNQPDPYIFARESYFQYRKNRLYDGHPPVETLDDFDFE